MELKDLLTHLSSLGVKRFKNTDFEIEFKDLPQETSDTATPETGLPISDDPLLKALDAAMRDPEAVRHWSGSGDPIEGLDRPFPPEDSL